MKIGKYTVYAPFLAGCDESDLYQQLRSVDRIWLFDRIAPSDENNEMAEVMMGTIFPDRCFRKKHNRIHRSRNEKNRRGAHYFISGRMCR
ncbi:TPA: toxin-activating lysine-acyltransferase [Morganella morganii]|nr:toxin-activating lysine-acyltransferase [Morganella morganii]HCR3776474.1 toxin-activating lysine-acyltransferase [Morganella morganii]